MANGHGRHSTGGTPTVVPLLRAAGRGLTTLLAVGTAAIMLASAAATLWLHVGIMPVLSGSMRPAFAPGAVVITRPVPVADVRPGDVIAFTPPGGSARYAHRVATVSGDPAHPTITTKGDANPAADPWHARLVAPTVPKVVGSAPWIGRLVVAAHGPAGRAALTLLAGALVGLVGTRAIMRQPRRRSLPRSHPRTAAAAGGLSSAG